MSPPVDRSITVSAPYLSDTASLRSSPSTSLVTALLPMFALTLQPSAMPMPIGSRFVWLHVGRDDQAPARDLVADELGLDLLARRDVGHLLGDEALAGVVHLRSGPVAGPLRNPLASHEP